MVYIVDKNGKSLLPTNRFGKVRRLLNDKKAKIIKRDPFTIQLLYEITDNSEDFNMDSYNQYKITLSDNVVLTHGNILIAGMSSINDDKSNLANAIRNQLALQSNTVNIVIDESYLKTYSKATAEKFVPASLADTLSNYVDNIMPKRLQAISQGTSNIKNDFIIIEDFDLYMLSDNYKSIDVIKRSLSILSKCSGKLRLTICLILQRPSGGCISNDLMQAISNKILIGPNYDDGIYQLLFSYDPNILLPEGCIMISTAENPITANSEKIYYKLTDVPYFDDGSNDIPDETSSLEHLATPESTDSASLYHLDDWSIKDTIGFEVGTENKLKGNIFICGPSANNILKYFKDQAESSNLMNVSVINGLENAMNRSYDAYALFSKFYNMASKRYNKGMVDETEVSRAKSKNFSEIPVAEKNPKFEVLFITEADLLFTQSNWKNNNLTLINLLCRIQKQIGIAIIISCTRYSERWLPKEILDLFNNIILTGPYNEDNFKGLFGNTPTCTIDSNSAVIGITDTIDEKGHFALDVINIDRIPGSSELCVPLIDVSIEKFRQMLNYSTSTLIYGQPGTGVSTVIQKLANKFKCLGNIVIEINADNTIRCSVYSGILTEDDENIATLNNIIKENCEAQALEDMSNPFTNISVMGAARIIEAVQKIMMKRFHIMELNQVNNIYKARAVNNDISLQPIRLCIDNIDELLNSSDDYNAVDLIRTSIGTICRLGRAAGVHLYITTKNLSAIQTDWLNNIQGQIAVGPTDVSTDRRLFGDYVRTHIVLNEIPKMYGRVHSLSDGDTVLFRVAVLDEILAQVTMDH